MPDRAPLRAVLLIGLLVGAAFLLRSPDLQRLIGLARTRLRR